MPDPTGAARQKRYRERQAGRQTPAAKPACLDCGIIHTGAHGALCSRCWERLTPEGKRSRADRVAKARRRKRANR